MKQALLLQKVNGRTVLKDTAKFFLYFVLFFGLAWLLIWGHMSLNIESEKTDIDDILSSQSLPEPRSFDYYIDYYGLLGLFVEHAMFALVCFGVFFSVPPKALNHVVAVSAILSFILVPPFLCENWREWIIGNLYLLGSIFLAWGSSHGWIYLRNKYNKT